MGCSSYLCIYNKPDGLYLFKQMFKHLQVPLFGFNQSADPCKVIIKTHFHRLSISMGISGFCAQSTDCGDVVFCYKRSECFPRAVGVPANASRKHPTTSGAPSGRTWTPIAHATLYIVPSAVAVWPYNSEMSVQVKLLHVRFMNVNLERCQRKPLYLKQSFWWCLV